MAYLEPMPALSARTRHWAGRGRARAHPPTNSTCWSAATAPPVASLAQTLAGTIACPTPLPRCSTTAVSCSRPNWPCAAWLTTSATTSGTAGRVAGLVLIDEIDQHLHPELQTQVVTELTRTFPDSQFVVTTHSPLRHSRRCRDLRIL